MRKALSGAVLLAAAALLLLPSAGIAKKDSAAPVRIDAVRHASAAVEHGNLPIDLPKSLAGTHNSTRAAHAAAAYAVGDVKYFLILNDYLGAYQLTTFTLRAIGVHGEVWVQNNLKFPTTPTNDCRNNYPDRINVTDAQVSYLLGQYDTNIWPKEADAFATAPSRDGSNAILDDMLGLPSDYYTGDGNRTVILVSNVRDDNYYDTNNANGLSYIAGFFSRSLNTYFDRNVMTIDSYDWLHRTTATPPDDTATSTLCAPGRPRPFLYEGTYAHEYQHLLESYSDPDEVSWVNEGLSDWAMSLTGYAHPEIQYPTVGYDGHIQAFQGAFLPSPVFGRTGGPEQSLTSWGDQGSHEILADYGAAYSFMTYLDDHFGNAFMSALHRTAGNGLAGLDQTLAEASLGKASALGLMNTWAVAVATDGLIDNGARILGPYNEGDYSSTKLSSTVNWSNPDAYDSPGAPNNGSDYVRLRDASGNFLTGGQIDSLSFKGATTLTPFPILWSSVTDAPGHAGDAAYFGGATPYRDATMTRTVTVPTGSAAKVEFDGYWNEETGWDFGFVQVSTDGGSTYQSLDCPPYTTSDTDPGALPTAKANVPGFTGIVSGWQHVTCSLAAYAGQTVALQFRSYNDPLTFGADESLPAGFWVDNITVGAQSFTGSMDGWKSMTEYRPTTVSNFVVTIMSVAGDKITLKTLPLNSDFSVHGKADVQKYVDKKADLVAAIVTYDDPSETATQYAHYELGVNGVVQPGG